MSYEETVNRFLNTLEKVKEPGVIFATSAQADSFFPVLRKHFKEFEEISLPLPDEKIDQIFYRSLVNRNPLLLAITGQTPSRVLRRLEQILKDGYLAEKVRGEWIKYQPSGDWLAVVWVDKSLEQEKEFILKDLFSHKLAL